MALKQSSSPYGYKSLLVYKKAEELQQACAELTRHFPPFSHSSRSKTLSALADQMDRSARSVKQNINELSDEKVIALVRVGKSELYREIMNRYQQKLLRYAKYLSLTEDEAKDVVQESFIKVYNNLYRFNIGKKFSSLRTGDV